MMRKSLILLFIVFTLAPDVESVILKKTKDHSTERRLKKRRKKGKRRKKRKIMKFKVKACKKHAYMDGIPPKNDKQFLSKFTAKPLPEVTSLLTLLKKKASNLSPNTTCQINARILPLIFYGLTRNVEFKLIITSDCFDKPMLQYFLLPYYTKPVLHVAGHPKFVKLNLFGRSFSFKFYSPFKRGVEPDINVAYKYVKVYPSSIGKKINTFEDNMLNLAPLFKAFSFKAFEVAKIRLAKNPSYCSLEQEMKVLNCKLEFIKGAK